MKLFIQSVSFLLLLLSFTSMSAQSGSSNNYIPELVFQNPVLISGTAGQDGAIYRFNNVSSGIDATVKITRRSAAEVVLTNIDVSDMGWAKAFQPQLGIPGSVASGKNWWMEFEMKFLEAGTNNKKKIKSFDVTALDVDGDGYYIQEYVQMNKVKKTSCSPITYLVADDASLIPGILDLIGNISGYNLNGSDKKFQGPKMNFNNIDTAATGVMSTYSYEDKDVISFVIGAKSSSGTSTVGERLNSLWFKAFSLAPQGTLPVKLNGFSAVMDKKNVLLNWSSATEIDFSHYVIQRSTDGKNFSDIALVFAAGSSGATTNYKYKDANISSPGGILYYRLRLVENTKEESYSDIRVIRLADENSTLKLATYPNPVSDQLRVTLPGAWQGKTVMIEIFSGNGTKVYNRDLNSASQTEILKMSSFARGFYLVKASCNGQTLEQRVIKD